MLQKTLSYIDYNKKIPRTFTSNITKHLQMRKIIIFVTNGCLGV